MNRLEALATLGAAFVAQTSPLTTVRVGAVAADSLSPILYAMRTGMFEKAGLKLDLQILGGGGAVTQAVVGGALDIGLTSLVSLMQAHQRGIPASIIAPGGLWIDANVAGLLVATDSPLRTARDFNGKVVATASLLSLGTVAMDAWMDQNGADSKSIRFLELPWSAAGAALHQGRVDAAIVENPAYAQALADGSVRNVTRIYTAIAKQFLLGVYFATGDYLAKNHSVATRFARVLADAGAFTRTHPDQTIDDVAQITKQDRDVIAHMQRTWVGTTVSVGDIQPVIEVAAKYHLIEKSFPAAEIISDAAVRS